MIQYLKKIGDVKTYAASEIKFSRVGIGFEKLDRAVFDPEKAYDRVAELGVKWVRIQSGWQRTETEKGVYHFEWLDSIVDNLRRRGLVPWVCLCYGNKLYDKQAAERFGGVGCPPTVGEEQIKSWHDYVVATVKHFAGRVQYYEIWNEPDCSYSWRYQCSALEYAKFAHDTSLAIREAGVSDAKVIGGAFAMSNLSYIVPLFCNGFADDCDAVSFHIYSADESFDDQRIENLKKIMASYKPSLELIQGEGGCQSRNDGAGALHGQAWTEAKQANSLSRHMISQLHYDVKFASYFSCMDMIEALNGKVGDKASYLDYGYFGVLGAEFDENGFSTGEYRPKPSYRALQVIASVFREEFSVSPIVIHDHWGDDPHYGESYKGVVLEQCRVNTFRKPNGSAAVVLWKKCNLLTERYEGTTALQFAGVPMDKIRIVDMLDGSIYAVDEKNIEHPADGMLVVKAIPVLDSPVMIAFGDFL